MQHSNYVESAVSGFHPEIAVIGMSGHYPGSRTLAEFWENILARRRQFRQMPDVRLPLSEYFHPDPKHPDTTYGDRVALIDGFELDWVNLRISKSTVDTTDVVHWLAIDVATSALKDAGFLRSTVPSEGTGVIVGNTLTGEQTRTVTVRLRWPFVRKMLRASAQARGLSQAVIDDLIASMEVIYKSVFAPITEDTLAGSLSNTIAGRVCNFFNLDGGGYTVDGACSSSLLAIADACTKLVNGDLNLALAGGVDISLDTLELIGFAKTGALTSSDMTVYDRKASGFIPGEGCGFVVLKRLEDARRDGDYIYSIIRGWGISSDGKGGITAPSSGGQAKAIRRAYAKAGFSPHTLDFIEGHGTGTPKGDVTELEGIALAMAQDGELAPRSVGMTSLKSIVGHTKAAAGVGAFIKAAMAVNQRIIPPTGGCTEPNLVFNTNAKCLYPILNGSIRDSQDILKAGVFGAGFGGINCHIAIVSGDAPAPHLRPAVSERALLVSNQESELFVLSAASIEQLLQRIQTVITQASGISLAEMADLAAVLAQESSILPIRAALIAKTPTELLAELQRLEQMVNDTPPAVGEVISSPEKTLLLSNHVQRNRVAFLFPGQGSQRLAMTRTLVERFSWAQNLVSQFDRCCHNLGLAAISSLMYPSMERLVDEEQKQAWMKQLAQTEVAQPAICLSSLIWLQYLGQLGITPVAVGGHSLGELTAFHAAGAFDQMTLMNLAALRGQVMAASTQDAGTMASLACSQSVAEELVQQIEGYVIVANINSPEQTIISGTKESVEAVLQKATAQGIQTHPLPVSNAFHSQMVAESAERLRREATVPETLTKLSTTLFSSVTGQRVQMGTNLRHHFADQAISPVNFIALVDSISSECDFMVEVGPGRVLTGLVTANTNQSRCLSVESMPGSVQDLNFLLATFFTHGGTVNWDILYANRLVRPFVPVSQKIFIENQCERPFVIPDEVLAKPIPVTHNALGVNAESFINHAHPMIQPSADSEVEQLQDVLIDHLTQYFSQRSTFLAQLVKADIESLPLLSSITPTHYE
jgi:enediyne polyketide synthase